MEPETICFPAPLNICFEVSHVRQLATDTPAADDEFFGVDDDDWNWDDDEWHVNPLMIR